MKDIRVHFLLKSNLKNLIRYHFNIESFLFLCHCVSYYYPKGYKNIPAGTCQELLLLTRWQLLPLLWKLTRSSSVHFSALYQAPGSLGVTVQDPTLMKKTHYDCYLQTYSSRSAKNQKYFFLLRQLLLRVLTASRHEHLLQRGPKTTKIARDFKEQFYSAVSTLRVYFQIMQHSSRAGWDSETSSFHSSFLCPYSTATKPPDPSALTLV